MTKKVIRRGHKRRLAPKTKRLAKRLRHYISDEHSGHKQYSKLAAARGLDKSERRTIRSMAHDEAGHEQRLKKILRKK